MLQQKLKLCSSPVGKCFEVARTIGLVDYVREITAKKSCYCGEYGSFEHLLLSFLWFAKIFVN